MTTRVLETRAASLQGSFLELAIQHRATQTELGLHQHRASSPVAQDRAVVVGQEFSSLANRCAQHVDERECDSSSNGECTQWNRFGAYDPFGGSSASHDEGTCVEDGWRQMLREFYGSAFASGVDGWLMFKNEDANRLALTIVARSRNRCEAPLLRRMFHNSFSEPRSMYCAREAVHFACNSFISMVRCVVGGT